MIVSDFQSDNNKRRRGSHYEMNESISANRSSEHFFRLLPFDERPESVPQAGEVPLDEELVLLHLEQG